MKPAETAQAWEAASLAIRLALALSRGWTPSELLALPEIYPDYQPGKVTHHGIELVAPLGKTTIICSRKELRLARQERQREKPRPIAIAFGPPLKLAGCNIHRRGQL